MTTSSSTRWRVFTLSTVLLLCGARVTRGQQSQKHALPVGQRVTAIAARAYCFEVVRTSDTLTVKLAFVPRSGRPARWWPRETTALLRRVRPDEMRFGVPFPAFELVQLELEGQTIRGRLALLRPEPENIGSPKGATGCVPQGMRLVGESTEALSIPKRK